jgi:hypothetical protein
MKEAAPLDIRYQASLFGAPEPDIDEAFSRSSRLQLDGAAWIDIVPGWLAGAERLFEQFLPMKAWAQRTRRMYDHDVLEPRLTARWALASGEALEPPVGSLRRHLRLRRVQPLSRRSGRRGLAPRQGGAEPAEELDQRGRRSSATGKVALAVPPLCDLGRSIGTRIANLVGVLERGDGKGVACALCRLVGGSRRSLTARGRYR